MRVDLTRIFHENSTAAAQSGMSTAWRTHKLHGERRLIGGSPKNYSAKRMLWVSSVRAMARSMSAIASARSALARTSPLRAVMNLV